MLFKQKRHGWNGTVILVWKFRSMRMHDDTQVKQATRSDPRITRVGAFIRRTSIDELPQLFNVLQGSMSLVGPRPHAIEHNDYYTDKINAYMARHRIKPGITGLAQISGSRGETETLEKMQRRVELDLAYKLLLGALIFSFLAKASDFFVKNRLFTFIESLLNFLFAALLFVAIWTMRDMLRKIDGEK